MPRVDPDPDFKYIAKVKLKDGKYRYFYDEETYKKFLEKGKELIDGIKGLGTLLQELPGKVTKAAEKAVTEFLPPKSIAALPVIKGKHSEEQDMAAVNEKYNKGSYHYMLNCMFCTTAYELRRRGYDVEADAIRIKEVNTYSIEDLSSWFENPKPTIIHTSAINDEKKKLPNDAIVKQILKTSPPGSRGNLCVFWKAGGGHSMVYEVSSSGNLVIRDTQANKTVQLYSLVEQTQPQFVVTRTDNLKLKEGVLDVIARN